MAHTEKSHLVTPMKFFSPSLDDAFLEVLRRETLFENEVIAVKLHMGEPMNKNHLKAEEVKRFADLLKKKGCKSFLFDTIVSYLQEEQC